MEAHELQLGKDRIAKGHVGLYLALRCAHEQGARSATIAICTSRSETPEW